jgi:hypothetical protein
VAALGVGGEGGAGMQGRAMARPGGTGSRAMARSGGGVGGSRDRAWGVSGVQKQNPGCATKEEGGALHIEQIFGLKPPRIQATDALTGGIRRNTGATDGPKRARFLQKPDRRVRCSTVRRWTASVARSQQLLHGRQTR